MPTNEFCLMSESDALTTPATCALSVSLTVTSLPSRVLTRNVLPSAFSIVPRTRTGCCACAAVTVSINVRPAVAARPRFKLLMMSSTLRPGFARRHPGRAPASSLRAGSMTAARHISGVWRIFQRRADDRACFCLRLVDHCVAQGAELGARDLHDVARLEPARRIVAALLYRGPGDDDFGRLDGHEGRHIGDDVGEREDHVRGVVVLGYLAVELDGDVHRLCRVDLVRRDDERPQASRFVEVLALGDVELTVAQPVAHRAFVAERVAGDVARGVLLRDVAPLAADHHGDLAFIVELLGHL